MAYINTRQALVDAATKHFQPNLSKCEDFDKFIDYVHREMDEIKTDVVKECIEIFDNELREAVPSDWTVKKRISRSVTCIFGKVKFKRTLFIDQYGRNRYLCDELLGIPKKARFSSDAFLWLIKTVAIMSYGKTAKAFYDMSGCKISKMAIWYMVQKEAELINTYGYRDNFYKISQESICVESDGIFVALQSPKRRKETINRFLYEQQHTKKSFEIKCGCIYAGKVKDKQRTKRINVDLVAGVESPYKFWKNINARINAEYRIEDLKHIYYGSDAGGWCLQQQLDMLPNYDIEVYQTIDRYHVMQAVWKAFPEGKSQDWLVSLILRRKPEAFIETLDKMLPKIHGKKKKKVRALRKYISNNIDLVKSDFNLGTMEATNAYVWAKRMKHIGGAWSVRGGSAMAIILAQIHSKRKLIPPLKNVFFTKQETKQKEKIQDKVSCRVANQTRVGCGYEPDRGHFAKETKNRIYIPQEYLPKSI